MPAKDMQWSWMNMCMKHSMKLMMCRSTKQICGRSVIVGDINGNCDAWRDYRRPDAQEKENMDRE